jgi:hypothetical protein
MTARTSNSDYPSPKEMQGWLEREIADAAKAMELRLKDASRLVSAYAGGDISPEEAAKRGNEYSTRWGEALPGVGRSQGMTDQEILAQIDETRRQQEATYRRFRGGPRQIR